MKTLVTCLLTFLMAFKANAQLLLKIDNDSLFAYSYSGGDEFNATILNENYWKNGIDGTRVILSQDLAFSPKNVEEKDGVINFRALKEDSTYVLYFWEVDSNFLKKQKLELVDNKFLTMHSAGAIESKQKFHYGFYEIRFKVEEGKGVWPAFWFFGGKENEEIDVFELKGEKNNQIHVDTHCPYGCDKGYKNNLGLNTNWGGWLPVSNYLHDGYNIMGLDWKDNELIWYLNGFPLAYFKGSFSNPMNLYLNTSVAKDGGAFKPGPDETTVWPNTYSIDYFRAWQVIKPDSFVFLNSNDNFISSTQLAITKMSEPKKNSGYIYKKKKVKRIDGFIYLSLSSKNKLTIRVLGKLKQKESTLKIITGNNTENSFTNLENEITIDLRKEEKNITVLIKNNGKEYSQKIELRN